MRPAPLPADEAGRLEALRALAVLDTPPEDRFDRLTRLAQAVFDVPIALVTLVDERRQWFKSCQGLDVSETPRSISFCAHAILQDGVFVVEDARKDERFADNPAVTGSPGVRFYAGAPLRAASGHAIGTLCIVGREPRSFGPRDREVLERLAECVLSELADLRVARVREEVAHHVNHELRTPLSAALLALDMLKEEALPPPARRLVDVAIGSGQHLLRMTRDLVDATKATTGKLALEVQDGDAAGALRAIAAALAPLAAQRGIALSLGPVPPSLPARFDPVRLRQVVGNLVDNALKFTPRGGHVELSLRAEEGEALFSVSDDGPGMSREDAARIFDRLYQTANKAHQGEAGLGLGLHICRELVAAHGGRIWVESEPGRGATFRFALPLR